MIKPWSTGSMPTLSFCIACNYLTTPGKELHYLYTIVYNYDTYFNSSCLIKMCTFLPEIHNMTQQSTTVLSNCTRCNKALSRSQGSWWCERCQKSPNLCCLCQKLVKGLFAWCQGCSHGGHLRCLKIWYQKNTLCPTGCGHHCEYQ